MITIAKALGKEYKDIELEDDALTTGGIAHQGETLGEFMGDDIDKEESIGELQKSLKECGIKQIPEADEYVYELIQQRLWDIEDDLGIKFEYYSWDYEEFD